ncbi:MAG: hypothetical protein ACKOBM_01860 [Gammaproteobacteria bacterium]
MSTEPRLPSAVPDMPAHFGSVMAHQPEILGAFGMLYGELWQRGVVPSTIREMTRLRNARVTDCGF